MASNAARHVAAVTTSYSRDSSLRDSDANDSLEAILDVAFSAAVAVCEGSVILVRAGTLAARWKLMCGSLCLDVFLQVDDHGGAADDDVVDVADLDGRRGIDGTNEVHFSFETPSQATVAPAAVATVTSSTIAWSSRGWQFRKSSSAPLSVADGSATNPNGAASQPDFSTAAASESPHSAATFPRVASTGAAYDKPPRSPLPSVTIAPSSPPLGLQNLSPDAAAARHMAAPQSAAARQQIAELSRGGLLSAVTPLVCLLATAITTTSTTNWLRRFGSTRGATAPSTPTGPLTSPATTKGSSSNRSTRAATRGGSARHLPHRPGTAMHPPSPQSISSTPASPHSISSHSASGAVLIAPRGSSNGDYRRQSFTDGGSRGGVAAGCASCGGGTEAGRGISRSQSWSGGKAVARNVPCAGADVPATSVAAAAASGAAAAAVTTTAGGGGFSNGNLASVALSIVPPSPSINPFPL
ncbi:unnamed protein product [Closterium sp. NIES-54]